VDSGGAGEKMLVEGHRIDDPRADQDLRIQGADHREQHEGRHQSPARLSEERPRRGLAGIARGGHLRR